MQFLQRAILSLYNFLVGDMRILIGTTVALLLTALVAPLAPALAGLLLVGLVGATLIVALQRELKA